MVKRKRNYFYDDPYFRMGRRLKEMRENRCLTISQVAEAIDVSNKTISNYENGHNRMTIETIIRINKSNLFEDLDLDELLRVFIVDIFERS